MTLAELKSGMALNIQSLYTFFLVADCGAMHLAASKLGVTPGAISQRIQGLERSYGKRLFLRTRNGVELTRAGQKLWDETHDAFARIEVVHESFSAQNTAHAVRVSVTAAFAHSSLVPRLGAFVDAHPHVRISIETEARLVDLTREPIDVAIRHGLGDYTGLTSVWLSAPEQIVVASPDLLKTGPSLQTPADCLHYRLLEHADEPDWALWFDAAGVSAANAKYGAAYKDDTLLVRAAVEAQGLALISDTYARDELAKGSLVNPLNIAWPTRFAYYAVARPETMQQPAVRAFVDWLRRDLAG